MQGKPNRARPIYSLTACFAALLFATPAHARIIEGSPGMDTLVGTSRSDTIRGRAGADQLYGRGSGDWLEGGYGDDVIVGGRGNDFVFGGYGDDLIFVWGGRSGVDAVSCGAGHDVVVLGPLDGATSSCETRLVR